MSAPAPVELVPGWRRERAGDACVCGHDRASHYGSTGEQARCRHWLPRETGWPWLPHTMTVHDHHERCRCSTFAML